ncbi:MAG: M48 family metallopeptidase [Tannerellaceae bacterium]|jgi:heat shock protein HtpX|nr:M48 family metallopeptidase [Tannerellaceae bacterium]
MKYIGIHTQKSRNNTRTLFLLILFPCLVIGLLYLFCFLFVAFLARDQYATQADMVDAVYFMFMEVAPYALTGVFLWFLIAYFANTSIIRNATGASPLERKENKRVYNLVENLCMSQGMKMPKINIIHDNSLNAFASGINQKSYTITLTEGAINRLDDEELEGVIAHELTHIRNNDVKLLIVSIVFVGIFTLIAQIGLQLLRTTGGRARGKDKGGAIVIVLIALVIAAIGYLFSSLMRFAISRKREYMADAGAAEMTKRPQALASALRKIALDPEVEAIKRKDVAQLFIENPKSHFGNPLSGLFATHPPIRKRIEILEQF